MSLSEEAEAQNISNTVSKESKFKLLLVLVAIAALSLDQITKIVIENNLKLGQSIEVIPGFFSLHFVRNPGAAFGMAADTTWIFTIISTLVALVVIWMIPKIKATSWQWVFGMLLGGILGNLVDRLSREPGFPIGHVVDWIDFHFFPAIFNIADSFIVISMGLFLILTLRGVNFDGSKVVETAAEDKSDGVA